MGTDIRTLISMGRKAGLSTRELYSALSGRPPEGRDGQGQADTNGYVHGTDSQGHNVYVPGGTTRN